MQRQRRRGGRSRLGTLTAAVLLAAIGVLGLSGPAYADAFVTVTDSADPVTVGTSYTYTVDITNYDSFTDASVTLSGAAAAITNVTSSNANLACVVATSTTVECDSIPPTTRIAVVTVTVLPSAAGTVTAEAFVNGLSVSGDDSESTTINAAGTDLAASVADSADPVNLGTTFTDTLTVANNGPTGATGVTASVTLSGASAGILSATSSQGSCSISAPAVSCTLGSLAVSASATVTLILSPTTTGTVTATATVDATEADPVSGNDSDAENTVVANGLGCTITGTNGNDTGLDGTNSADVICGLAGNDEIEAGGGNDVVYGGPGADTLLGGNGTDTIYAGDGDDTIAGGNGDDTLYGEAGNDTSKGETLVETLLGLFDNGADHIYGGPGDDDLHGQNGNDTLLDHTGTDTMSGDLGNDDIDVQDGTGGDAANGGLGSDTCATDGGDTATSC
ncbi:CARDB domain-containing protein [Streptosporangium sp. NPDC051023]|uniref:CARDB domain-containing protein n=1 Tax=Streptosporangium sp. NPDC051023 TaxID=3155410 RepID=UPI00344C424E